MPGESARPEVDERMLKLLVGLVAIWLPILVQWIAWPTRLGSISAAYWEPFWPQTIFIGFLFAIAALLLSYDGRSNAQRVAAKLAATAALLIALYPCQCTGHEEILKGVHYGAAIVMYLVLAFFCWTFRRRALAKGWRRARRRARVYEVCLVGLGLAIAALALNFAMTGALVEFWKPFVFFWEAVGLFAFGLSWLTASHWLPVLNASAERFRPLARHYTPPLERGDGNPSP